LRQRRPDPAPTEGAPATAPLPRRRRRLDRALAVTALALALYLLIAYGLLPAWWMRHEREAGLATLPMLTRTAQGIPGDAINLAVVGDEREILCAMAAAGWTRADPVTLRSSLAISGSVLLDRAYPRAPVSPLYYDGRREDLAFEQAVGGSADRRHHVRLWRVQAAGDEGRPVWLGAATYDRGIGFSHYTGAITHHIGPDIDAERALIAGDLARAGLLAARFAIPGRGATLIGRNGGGDPYYTDGLLWVLRLAPDCRRSSAPPQETPVPVISQFRDQLWRALGEGVAAATAN
jgi:hypothetical protein